MRISAFFCGAARSRCASALLCTPATRLAMLLVVLLATGAQADRVLFDFEGPYLYEPGFTVKDHDLISDGQMWHAFYIRGTEGVPGTSSETEFGHATTTDLRNWIIMPPVLDAGPQNWDQSRIWAPDIRPDGPGWSMYYTGVAPDFLQRMGAASSTNLSDWVKSGLNPVAEPDSNLYLWSPDLDNAELSAFRDPFRFEYEGQTHLLNSVLVPDSILAAGRRGAIHHLVDDGAGGWTDVGPLALNNSNSIGAWRELESVQMIETGNRWHLFFTYFGLDGVYWVGNDSLEANWDISSAQKIDDGVGAEITDAGNGDWILTRHGAGMHAVAHPRAGEFFYVLRADTLRFDPGQGPPTVLRNTVFEQQWPDRQGLAFVAAPTFGDNFLERGMDRVGQEGHGYLSSYDLYDGPFGEHGAPGADLGPIATGTIHSAWFSVAPDDSSMTMRVAGPVNPDCLVRIVRRISADGEALITAPLDSTAGSGSNWFVRRDFDLRAWRGYTIRLEVEDLSELTWIGLDDVRIFSSNPPHTATPKAARRGSGRLEPNRPNPFNPRTELRFSLDKEAECYIELFDLRGRRVARLDAGHRQPGQHTLLLDASELSSGTYLVRLLTDGAAADHRKISLVR